MLYSNGWSVKKPIPCGFAVYDKYNCSHSYGISKWYLYPFFRLLTLIIGTKYKLYSWLEEKGIMTTPEGNIATIKDMKFLKKSR